MFHVDVRDVVDIREGGGDVHLLHLVIVVICYGKEDTKGCVPSGSGEDCRVIEVLHVSAGNEVGLVLYDSPGAIAIELIFPGVLNNTRKVKYCPRFYVHFEARDESSLSMT
jgi:hypothetical protein